MCRAMEPVVSALPRHAGDAMMPMFRHTRDVEARIWRDAWMVFAGQEHALGHWLAVIEPGLEGEAALRGFVATLQARKHSGLVYFSAGAAAQHGTLADALSLGEPGSVPLMVWRAGEQTRSAWSSTFPAQRMSDEPALHMYGAEHMGRLVSVAAAYWEDAVGYVGIMATLPDLQGHGAGRAVFAPLLADGAQPGISIVHLISSVEGRRLYERVGFRVADPGVRRTVPVV